MMERLTSGAERLGIRLTSRQVEQFETYYHELFAWNRKVNLTRITDYDEVQVKHFLDSLTAVPVIDSLSHGKKISVIDVGSGAGLPGLPLKIVRPGIGMVLLEATAKKTEFLRYLVNTLELGNIDIKSGRSEEIAHLAAYRERFDIVLSRAVTALPALVELTLPLCKIGGLAIAYKKGDITGEIEQAGRAIESMGGVLREMRPIEVEELGDRRCLVTIEKMNPTPPQYPRRPGMSEKRPILS